jgi:hypothetical protein
MLNLPKKVLKKLHTLFSDPVGVYFKYVGRMETMLIKLKGGVPPIYGENYNRHWGYTTFKNKVVLDLGADYGSTAYYFLGKGAKKVIAVEGDRTRAEKLASNFKKDERVIPITGFIKKAEQIDSLISLYHPDIVKADIEGDERCIPNMKKVEDVREWLIEAHTPQICNMLYNFFKTLDYKVEVYDYLGSLKILYCRR